MWSIPKTQISQPIVLSEFGGIALSNSADATWGYTRCNSADEFLERYRALLKVVRSLPTLSGFCYTQFTDTYQEANGLLYANREPKAPFEEIASATSGKEHAFDALENCHWRDRLMELQK